MKYREAKDLQNGDQVIRKDDKVSLVVQEVQIFGQYKKVLLHCVTEHNARVSLYNEEVE